MQKITIRLERVFDVAITSTSSNGPVKTLFSFESSKKRHFGIVADGTPSLQSGQTITAILRRENDWRTLEGFIIHETKEISCRSPSFSLWPLPMIIFSALIAYISLAYHDEKKLWLVLGGHGVVFLFLVWQATHSFRMREALRLSLSNQPGACPTFVDTQT